MLLPLGELDEGEEILPVPPHHLPPDRRRLRPSALPLVEEGEFPGGLPRRARTRAPEKGIEEADGIAVAVAGQKKPRGGEAVPGVAPGVLPRGIDQLRQMGREGRERQDVQAVVFEDVGHEPPVPPPEPVEIPLGDLAAGDVPLPFESQDHRLQGAQPAVAQAMAQQAPGGVEQVQVGQSGEGVPEGGS